MLQPFLSLDFVTFHETSLLPPMSAPTLIYFTPTPALAIVTSSLSLFGRRTLTLALVNHCLKHISADGMSYALASSSPQFTD